MFLVVSVTNVNQNNNKPTICNRPMLCFSFRPSDNLFNWILLEILHGSFPMYKCPKVVISNRRRIFLIPRKIESNLMPSYKADHWCVIILLLIYSKKENGKTRWLENFFLNFYYFATKDAIVVFNTWPSELYVFVVRTW